VTGAGGGEWWSQAFRRPYLDLYAHRDDASADDEVSFVASQLALRPGARLLDAGCGAGRHARAFARRGAAVVGVDRSGELLREADFRGKGPRYVLADVRGLPFAAGAFDHATSLFTSFGYFDDAGDRRQLGELRRVLRAGGTFVFDFLNRPHVEATLVPESEREIAGRSVRERRRIRDGRVEKDVEIAGGESWRESVRLYGALELTSMLASVGFVVRSRHGDLAGGAWSEESPRLVLTAAAT
jgi:SAM-dependent methyltransferase